MGAFIAELRAQEGVPARALEFAILTAARISEAVNATWDEIDLDKAVWTIPADRIKMGREHRVPLSGPALSVLDAMTKIRRGNYVFPGIGTKQGVSRMSPLKLLERMGCGELTVHGFRASFRTWAQEATNFPREVAERALAHVVENETEFAYARSDLLEKRRLLMDAWARHCGTIAPAGEVVPLHRINANE